jgi:hypothetical protein
MHDTLANPITREYFNDVFDLEKKRRDILKEAKRIEKLDKDITKAQDMSKHAKKNMEEKYYNLL